MMRWVCLFVAFALTLFIGFFGYIFIHRAEFLSVVLTRMLHTPVTVADITYSRTGIGVSHLRISNHPECTLKKAFSVDSISVTLDWMEFIKAATGIMSEDIVVSEIVIHRPYIGLELFDYSGSDNNWKRILNRVPTSDEAATRKYIVRKLVITQLRVDMLQPVVSSKLIRPPVVARIEVTNLGENGPLSTQQLLYAGFIVLLDELSSDLKLQALTQGIKHLPLNLTKQTLQIPQKLTETVLNGVSSIGKKIFGFFQPEPEEKNMTK